MLVGREDGVVEVYSFDESGEPRIQFTHVSMCVCVCCMLRSCPSPHQVMGESITAVCGGKVGSTSQSELILSTFSGQVIGLTRDTPAGSGAGPPSLQPDLQDKIKALR